MNLNTSEAIIEEKVFKIKLPKYLVLHIIPGILIFLFYILTAPWFVERGFQAAFALHLGFLFIGIPLEVGILVHVSKRNMETYDFRKILSYTNKLSLKEYIIYVVLFYAYYFIFIVAVMEPVSNNVFKHFFSWAPNWYLDRSTFLAGNPTTLIVLLSFALRFIIDGLLNPFVEELYFRGYLLPKLEKLGIFAPIINALLFSAAHLWQPYNFLLLFATVFPIYLIVWKKRSIYLSIIIHCSANFLSSLLLLIQFFS